MIYMFRYGFQKNLEAVEMNQIWSFIMKSIQYDSIYLIRLTCSLTRRSNTRSRARGVENVFFGISDHDWSCHEDFFSFRRCESQSYLGLRSLSYNLRGYRILKIWSNIRQDYFRSLLMLIESFIHQLRDAKQIILSCKNLSSWSRESSSLWYSFDAFSSSSTRTVLENLRSCLLIVILHFETKSYDQFRTVIVPWW